MKPYAVAFNYENTPKYNKTEVENDIINFYMDDVLVQSYRYIPGVVTTFPRSLGIEIVEAEDEKSAMIKVVDQFRFNIMEMTALEIPMRAQPSSGGTQEEPQ